MICATTAALEMIHKCYPAAGHTTLLLPYRASDVVKRKLKGAFQRRTGRTTLPNNLTMFSFSIFDSVSRSNAAGPKTQVSALPIPILPRRAPCQSASFPLFSDSDGVPSESSDGVNAPVQVEQSRASPRVRQARWRALDLPRHRGFLSSERPLTMTLPMAGLPKK
jgi:hypothetical protein